MTANRAQAGRASTSRVRCPVCSQYPMLTKEGALRNHSYPWYHSQSGQPCPASGSQIMPLEGQTSLDDVEAYPTRGDRP